MTNLNTATIHGKKLSAKQKKLFRAVCEGKKMQMGGRTRYNIYAKGGTSNDSWDFLFDDDEDEQEEESPLTAPSEEEIQQPSRREYKTDEDYDQALIMSMNSDPERNAYRERRMRKRPEEDIAEEDNQAASAYYNNVIAPKFGTPKGTPNQNAAFAYSYLQQKGIQPHIAAGIVGNLMQESGLKTDAIGDGGKARGIAQWHPDRFAGLQTFAKGRNPYALDTQLDYLVHEASSRGDLKKMSIAKNSGEAAYLFAKHFERPKVIDSNRIQYARQLHP